MARQVQSTVELTICPTKLDGECESAYEKRIIEEIAKATNALRNGRGGIIILPYSPSTRGNVKKTQRKLEQKIQTFLGTVALTYDIKIVNTPPNPDGHGEIRITVKTSTKTDEITTIRYNMYLPSDEQVNEISPTEHVETVRAIMIGTIPSQKATKEGSHHKDFVKGESVPFPESKTVQFKKLEDKKGKKSSLATRIVRKGNKFRCYVSAFGNYAGGHIYFGINDDGIVEGEHMKEDEKKKVKELISKEMEKMVWPKQCQAGDGNEDNRWAVHFEPVKGSENTSLYVVVVFVAHCPGGVFTEAPQCYEVVENKGQRMNFVTWKTRIHPSFATEEPCCANASHLAYETLTTTLNEKRNRKELVTASKTVEEKYKGSKHSDEVKLICLSKLVSYYLRRGEYPETEVVLKQYHNLLSTVSNALHFKIMEKYLLSIMERCKGNYERSYEIAKDFMDDLKKLPSCIISVAFYVQIGTLENILAIRTENREKRFDLLKKAEENYDLANSHLNSIQGNSPTKAEFEQKIYINKCILHLGSSLAGEMLPNSVEKTDLEKASNDLTKMQQIIDQGHPLNDFRKIQNFFAHACLSYRMCMSEPSRHTQLLQDAVMYTEEAKTLAEKCVFDEMTRYARNYNKFFKSEQIKCKS